MLHFCMRSLWVNGLLVFAIFSFFSIVSYPLLINASSLITWEEAEMINRVIDILKEKSVFFYYDGVSYQGILDNLFALPFFYFLGINSLSLKLAHLSIFSLYIWSSVFLATLIKRETFWVVLILLLFPSINAFLLSYTYPTYSLTCLLGNIIFILFCRIQSPEGSTRIVIFFLSFFIGLSIYTYTYSILYIASIAILFILNHPEWNNTKSKISLTKFKSLFWVEQTPKEIFIFIFDLIISAFILCILFSYVFGGFGIDVGGITIFQINNLHKPVGQLAILIFLRTVFLGKHKGFLIKKALEIQVLFNKNSKRLFFTGLFGFFLGIAPRLASIVSGETKRGGQGFDIDLNPIKILMHSWDFILVTTPEILGFSKLIKSIPSLTTAHMTLGGLALAVMISLTILTLWQFCNSQIKTIKNIIFLRQINFTPAILLFVFPLMVFLQIF